MTNPQYIDPINFVTWIRTWLDDVYEMKPPSYSDIILTSDKNVLSHYDSDTCTLTAQLVDENNTNILEGGVLIQLFKDNSLWDTIETDSTGKATKTYNSNGIGNVSFKAKNNKIVSEPCEIEDILYFNDGTKLNNLYIESGVSVTTVNNSLKITTSTSGEKKMFYPPVFDTNSNFEYEIETVAGGNTDLVTAIIKDSTTANGLWCGYKTDNSINMGCFGSTSVYRNLTFASEKKLRLVRYNGTIKIYFDDILILSKTGDWSGSFQVGHYTNQNRVQYVKNIKIKIIED